MEDTLVGTPLPKCKQCNEDISQDVLPVTCDKCGSTFHERCVKVNDNMQVWRCLVCEDGQGSGLKPPFAPRSYRSRTPSRRASDTSSRRAKQKAMLDALEEEKALLIRQAKEKEDLLNKSHAKEMEFIKKKQETIMELASSCGSSSRSSLRGVATVTGAEKVQSWITSQPIIQDKILPPPAGVNFCKDLPSSTQVPDAHVTFKANRAPDPPPQTVNTSYEVNRTLNRGEIAARHVVKDLPKFDGNPKSWPKFITSFNRSTKVCGYNNLENLERLTQALSGNALAAVESSLLMEENVPRILKTLELLYGKPEFIIGSLLEDLRHSVPPTFESIDSILRYSLEVENLAMTMVNAKLAEHVWNPLLLNEIVEKLPTQLKFEWAAYKHNYGACSIEVFSVWLKNIATTYASIMTKPPNIRGAIKKETKHTLNIHQDTKVCLVCNNNCNSAEVCSKFKELTLQEKWSVIRKNQICRICLKKHTSQKCKIDTLCGIDGCQYRHNKMLHQKKEEQEHGEEKPIDNANASACNIHANESTYFKVLPVILSSGANKVATYAMLDDGSSLTLLDKSIADELNLVGDKNPLCLRWTNGLERREHSSEIVSFNISKSTSDKQFKLRNVRTIENLCLPRQSVNMELLSSKYEHLKNVDIKSFEDVQPLILIGLSHSKIMAVQKYKFGRDGEPSAAKTPIGWCIFGCGLTCAESVLHIQHCECEEKADHRLEDMVKTNYTLDSIGISQPSSMPQAKAEQRAMEMLSKTVKLCGNRYETGLLWKFDRIHLPNSLPMAMRRLQCLEKKIAAEPGLRVDINRQIEDYIAKGYVHKLGSEALKDPDVWYLPIFLVHNENKPNKIRMVWDAAAEVNGVSLNHVLLKGPDLLSSLPGILLRFREHRVAVSGDIQEMFHQVMVKQSDLKYQRFLWRKSVDDEIEVFEMCVMTFGACCSPSCSQYVKNLSSERFRQKFPSAVDAIQSNHYVDDWLQSVDSTSQAVTLANEVRCIHKEAGFHIHKWISNCPEVVQSLNNQPITAVEKNMELSPKFETDKVLGMFWSTSTDEFEFVLKLNDSNAKLMSGETIPTKRTFLKLLMSIFDPLGLITPVLIYAKILLQSIWRTKTNWDDNIDFVRHDKWMIWCQSLKSLSNLSIQRWIGLRTTGTAIEVHTFVDASEDAYAAAVYFKVIDESKSHCSLVMSKSRVAPLKSLSIPRLELQAAVLGVRLTKFVEENRSPVHFISKRYFWSDSETVIKWLNSDSRKYTQYVACRVGEILENSKQSEWNWIPGRQNIADMGTKMRVFDSSEMQEWFYGPKFLHTDSYPMKTTNSSACEVELRSVVKANHIAFHEETEYRVGKWTKLRRVFAYVIRYVLNLFRRIKGKQLNSGPITSEEYRKSENFLIRKAQHDGFFEEYKLIESGKRLHNKRSVIFKDTPFMDEDGILRANGRIQFSPYIPYDMKNPILLPKGHRITEMIIHFYHERYHHLYVATVANEIKQKFAVNRLKTVLKVIRRNCQTCKNRDARPKIPEEGQLPPARITPYTRPFTYIGIDYFGPVQVSVGRKREKRWCMLITCLTTRALHLEIVHSLTSDSCIQGLQRFMNRRGKPRQIFTDNGTNFKGSQRELREMWNSIDKNKVAESFIDTETEWMFIPPASPHMGGAWERMVRTVKTSLKAAFPYRTPSDELLLTMLAEVENIINNRPLTYVELEDEYQEALTPNHFILGSTSGYKPLGEFRDDSGALRENWHHAQRFANVFWKRWVAEYLPTLNRRTKWFQSPLEELAVEDIVIVLGEERRGYWPKGRVLEVHRSKDNRIRSATIQLETGIYTRPVSKLAKLDVRSQQNDGTLEPNTRIPGGSITSTCSPLKSTRADPELRQHTRTLRALPHRS